MIRQTPEERAEYIIRTEALYGPAIDTNSIRTAIAVTVREAIEQERESNPLLAAAPDLLAALTECADELEIEIKVRYPMDVLDYPSSQARLKRDMGPVVRARAAIAKAKGES